MQKNSESYSNMWVRHLAQIGVFVIGWKRQSFQNMRRWDPIVNQYRFTIRSCTGTVPRYDDIPNRTKLALKQRQGEQHLARKHGWHSIGNSDIDWLHFDFWRTLYLKQDVSGQGQVRLITIPNRILEVSMKVAHPSPGERLGRCSHIPQWNERVPTTLHYDRICKYVE